MAGSNAFDPEEYIRSLTPERQEPIQKLRAVFLEQLPDGFKEQMGYGMIGYVVPHSIYPPGYHCDPRLPLPFINLASQKNHIAVYHMGLYADPVLMDWFTRSYAKTASGKLDMGKSCIRFKNPDKIPFALIGDLASKMQVKDWIQLYETKFVH